MEGSTFATPLTVDYLYCITTMANSSEYSLHAPNPNDNSTYILIYVCDVCVAVVFMRYLNLRGHMYLFFFYLFIITRLQITYLCFLE